MLHVDFINRNERENINIQIVNNQVYIIDNVYTHSLISSAVMFATLDMSLVTYTLLRLQICTSHRLRVYITAMMYLIW